MSLETYEMPHSPYCIPILHALDYFEISFHRQTSTLRPRIT
ncbi:MAG: hypothetical protein OSB65_05560 [Roseibacillus sp.]|jgi:hypothetical protein|nr:hypothetical protein [Roseibacillus sp.]